MSTAPASEAAAPPFRVALGTIVAASAAPYGYTVSIWCSGAILMGAQGLPSGAEVVAFMVGALCGFALLGLAARSVLACGELLDDAGDRVAVGTLHWLAVSGAIGAVALVAGLPGWEAWPLGSFVATTTYLLGASVQLAFVTSYRTRRRTRSLRVQRQRSTPAARVDHPLPCGPHNQDADIGKPGVSSGSSA